MTFEGDFGRSYLHPQGVRDDIWGPRSLVPPRGGLHVPGSLWGPPRRPPNPPEMGGSRMAGIRDNPPGDGPDPWQVGGGTGRGETPRKGRGGDGKRAGGEGPTATGGMGVSGRVWGCPLGGSGGFEAVQYWGVGRGFWGSLGLSRGGRKGPGGGGGGISAPSPLIPHPGRGGHPAPAPLPEQPPGTRWSDWGAP